MPRLQIGPKMVAVGHVLLEIEAIEEFAKKCKIGGFTDMFLFTDIFL